MLLVGVVARAQGNKGEVVVNSTTDFPDERFAAGASAVVPARRRRDRSGHGAQLPDAPGAAGARGSRAWPASATPSGCAGAELRVPASAQRQLPAHVYYVHELVGCAVWTAAASTWAR